MARAATSTCDLLIAASKEVQICIYTMAGERIDALIPANTAVYQLERHLSLHCGPAFAEEFRTKGELVLLGEHLEGEQTVWSMSRPDERFWRSMGILRRMQAGTTWEFQLVMSTEIIPMQTAVQVTEAAQRNAATLASLGKSWSQSSLEANASDSES